MKSLILLLPIFLILSCSNAAYIGDKKTATIRGTIINTPDHKVEFRKFDEIDTAIIVELKDSTFEVSFDLEKPAYFRIEHNKAFASLFLQPGYELNLSITDPTPGRLDESISYRGDGAKENKYLAAYYQKRIHFLKNFNDLLKQEPQDFLLALAHRIDTIWEFHYNFVEEHPGMDPRFIKTRKAAIKLDKAFPIVNYPAAHKYLTKKDSLVLPAHFYAYLEELDVNAPEFSDAPMYVYFVKQYLDTEAEKRFGDVKYNEADLRKRTQQKFGLVPEYLEQQTTRDLLYKELTIDYLNSFREKEGMDVIVDLFNQKCGNESYKEYIKVEYDKRAKLLPGRSAPLFSYPDINDEQISLSDFNDKYVYIDVWATWCSPCLKEIPHLEKIQEKFKSASDLVFISISVDEDKEAWEKMVKEKELGGWQLIASQAWESQIIKDYCISGIPHFMLISPGGIIVSSEAPRPSGDELDEMLTDVLAKQKISMVSPDNY